MRLAEALSERLKSLREEKQLSQQELAVKADLSLSLVAKLEQGKKADPRASTLIALAGALSVTPGVLLDDLDLTPESETAEAATAPKGKGKKDGKKKHKKKKV